MSSKQTIVLIGGPTASGKSSLAQDIAEHCQGTVINADSMQIYSDLKILTARPSATVVNNIPYQLYGVLDGAKKCSAAQWHALAIKAIEDTLSQGRTPILVGGTGLYFKALTEGLAPMPAVEPKFLEDAQAYRQSIGAEAFHQELQKVDPELGAKLFPADTQRVLRAWSVYQATGIPLSIWQKKPSLTSPAAWHFHWVVLTPPREELYISCNERFQVMIDTGAVEEVRQLMERHLSPALPIMKALGVPELMAYLQGKRTLDQAIEKAQLSTRHYAKRQTTWFRHQVLAKASPTHTVSQLYRSDNQTLSSILSFLKKSP